MAEKSTFNYVMERPPLIAAIVLAFIVGGQFGPGMVGQYFVGPERAVEGARIQAHGWFPNAVKAALVGLGRSPQDKEDVEDFLRSGDAYQSMPTNEFQGEWEVGVNREDVIPVSVFYYQDRANGLSSGRPYGYGLACVEYRIGEEWEVIDVPCGWEAMMQLRAMNRGLGG